MQILQHTISTKAGETQILRWLVVQAWPYPTIGGECGRLKWQNTEGLFDRYQHPAAGLGQTYTAYLLATGAEPGEAYSRADFAGHVDYHTSAVKPGSIKLRGKELGETNITLCTQAGDFPTIRVSDGCTTPNPSERKLLEDQVIPVLRAFIKQHAAILRGEAISAVQKKFQTELSEKRAELDKLQAQIAAAKF